MTEADVEKLFIPDAELVKRYQAQLTSVLNNPASAPQYTIELGELPAVYKELGIQDKELKMNTTTVLKAIGRAGENKHHVSNKVFENLVNYVYDPKGVFRSLDGAKNPDGYVAVLNVQSAKQEPIVAILSPSKDGKGFTFIPSVYDKQNFENFLERTHKENKVLYIKEKGNELWGQHQLLPRHNSLPYTTSIQTKSDIVKRIFDNAG